MYSGVQLYKTHTQKFLLFSLFFNTDADFQESNLFFSIHILPPSVCLQTIYNLKVET